MKFFKSIFLIGILFASACNPLRKATTTEKVYQKSIVNSMYPTEKKQATLTVINKKNPSLKWKTIADEDYVLMLTWKAKNYYPTEGIYNTGMYETWVTAAPELYNFMQNHPAKDKSMRLKQLLGLPPTAQNSIFIEFWVKPADLFRPCPNKDINEGICNTYFSASDSTDADYITWFNTSRIDRYFTKGLYNQYPWTQLGYTYDWNPKNKKHRGVSEFVIGKNKTIYVNKSYTTDEYLRLNKKN